jgi:DNA-binding NtrC family response regulator
MYIMVVEDDDDMREAYLGMVRLEGYGACWASTLSGARRHLRVEEVDLVLLDVELHGSMCGLELLPLVPRGVPVFVVSGHPEPVVRGLSGHYLLDPATRFFRKPADLWRLAAELRAVASLPRGRRVA